MVVTKQNMKKFYSYFGVQKGLSSLTWHLFIVIEAIYSGLYLAPVEGFGEKNCQKNAILLVLHHFRIKGGYPERYGQTEKQTEILVSNFGWIMFTLYKHWNS